MQQDVAQPRHRVGVVGPTHCSSSISTRVSSRRVRGSRLMMSSPFRRGQRLIDPLLEQQRRIAVLAEQVEQDEVVLRLALFQKGEGIGLVQGWRTLRVVVGLKEQLIEGDHLFIEVDALVTGIGPALVQMAGEIAAPSPSSRMLPACSGSRQAITC